MEACTKRKVGKPVKPHHIQKYEALTDTVELESPVLSKAESQFSGLMESLLSPEYKKADLQARGFFLSFLPSISIFAS